MSLRTQIRSVSSLEATTVKIGGAVVGVISLSLVVREVIEVVRLNSAESPWAIEISCGFMCPKMRIALAAIVMAGCLFSLSLTRFVIAIVPLGWIISEYAYWLSRSLNVKRYYDSLGVSQWPEGRALGFVGATWWDILLLLVTILVLIWWMKMLGSAFYHLRFGRTKN